MSLWLAVALLTFSGAEPRELAITPFRVTQLNPELGGFAEDRLAEQLSRRGFKVLTPAALQTVLGFERQKQLLGCDETAGSCLAELSAALGVPLLATGRLTKLGSRIELDLQVVRQRDAQVVARVARSVDDEARLGQLIADAAEDLARQLKTEGPVAAVTPAVDPPRVSEPEPSPPTPFNARLWVPVALGAAAVAGGGVLIGLTQSEVHDYTTPGGTVATLSGEEVQRTSERLELQRALGWSLVGVGAGSVALGIVWTALVPAAPVSVSASLGAQGGLVSVGGTW